MATQIKVDLTIVNAKPPLQALADVKLMWPEGEITIRRCAVFQKANEPPWATLPRIPIEKNGKRQYVPLLDLPRELKTRVLEALLNGYRSAVDTRA